MSDTDLTGGRPLPASSLAVLGRGVSSPRFGALVTIVATAALGAGLIVWTLQPEYVPVGEQSSRAEALEIVDALGNAGVDFRLDPNTGLVLVPGRELESVRLTLAAAGLGERSGTGLELLQEEPALGTSHFTETARYRHALETELARTIATLRNVESARVHLALPERSVFVRDRAAASASVTIRAQAGRSIEEEQVRAIVNLVAASIPHLQSGEVTVVDQWGRLLSSGDAADGGMTRERYDHARRLERLYSERVESLLAPLVGRERVRATVTAELDHTVSERTEEAFEGDPAQLRSEQSETRVSDEPLAGGVPGALTNQPPGEGFVEGEEGADGEGAENVVDRAESTVRNFELDKTITHVRQAPGQVLRLSAAVVIDDRVTLDAEGNTVRTPLTPEEIAEYAALVREAIGFDEARGDSVPVFNRAFRPIEEIPPPAPAPLWEQEWVWTVVRQCLVGLAVLLLVLTVLRPAVRRLGVRPVGSGGTPAEARLDAPGGETGDEASGESALPSPEGRADAALGPPPVVYGDILAMARVLAAEDPKRVAKVVKDWVGEP